MRKTKHAKSKKNEERIREDLATIRDFFKSSFTDVFTLLITSVSSILVALMYSKSTDDWYIIFIKYGVTFLLLIVVVHLPKFVIGKFNDIIKKNEKNLEKINECPRLTAFQTENNSLKKRLESMDDLDINQRWQLSMFITKLLSSHFKRFSLKMETMEYSQFSKEIMKECSDSVLLTGSMRPSTWLNRLADNSNDTNKINRKNFFNNLVPFDEFPIDKDNHSVFLNKCDFIHERLRVVCLTPEDMDYLFISEQSVDAYFKFNSEDGGIQTFYTAWEEEQVDEKLKSIEPLKYEYALYDKSLLFKFDKEEKVLTVINGKSEYENETNKSEFEAISTFFNLQKNNKEKQGYDFIIKRIQSEKIKWLSVILKTNRLPHKFSYLYSGGQRWADYTEKHTKYGNDSTMAISSLLRINGFDRDNLNIVEIGAGTGSRLSSVCDSLGTTSINSYTLVDISKSLLDESVKNLEQRLSKNKCKIKTVVLDCCKDVRADRNKLVQLVSGKTVLILSNTTIFKEYEYRWDNFKEAKQIFITLDLYADNTKTFQDQLKAKDLFLLPLKTFEIPIIDEVVDGLEDYLFTDNKKDYIENQGQNEYNIYFNLKSYIEILTRSKIDGGKITSPEIALELSNRSDLQLDIMKRIEQYWEKSEKVTIYYNTKNKSEEKSKEYIEKRNQLFNMSRLIVLSSLKFKKYRNEKITIAEIKKFFVGKGFSPVIQIKGNFVGILLRPN